MTKVQAIKKLMEDNEGLASWSLIYQDIDKYYPKAKDSKEWKAGIRWVLYRDIDKTFKKLDDGLFSLINFEEEKYIAAELLSQTEKIAEIKTRIGQSFFRKSLLKETSTYPFTGVSNPKLLIASHIKPWSKSDNIERLDIKNGFMFTPTYDLLFDKGYISFKDDKSLIVSEALDKHTINSLNLIKNSIVKLLPINGREFYLEYHRDIVFKKAG
ncbi:MAG: HNH endonuclease [Campylobacterota bacterium]|nr:HNH endonuclease [Campylobacterota bacterium]